jgi:hypothetical protein
MSDADEDLYGDLMTDQTLAAVAPRASTEQIKALQQENDTLKRNMGVLYRTAMAEIQRKNEQLAQLEQHLREAKQQGQKEG